MFDLLLIGGVNRLSFHKFAQCHSKRTVHLLGFRFLQNKCILSFRFRAHVNMTLNGRGAGPGSGPTSPKITNAKDTSQ